MRRASLKRERTPSRCMSSRRRNTMSPRLWRMIRSAGCRAGLTLNPATPFTALEPHLANIDLLLIMTVHPGFGGQAFRPEMMEKVRSARADVESSRTTRISTSRSTAASTPRPPDCASENGANVLVAGTSVFGAPDYAARRSPRCAATKASPQWSRRALTPELFSCGRREGMPAPSPTTRGRRDASVAGALSTVVSA